jgi:hypothetical protein
MRTFKGDNMNIDTDPATSREVTQAYAWLAEQMDDRVPLLIEQGANMTAACMQMPGGVWVSALPVLVDRDPTDEVEVDCDDEPDETDDDGVTFTLEGFDLVMHGPPAAIGPIDRYEAMAENSGVDWEFDAELLAEARRAYRLGESLYPEYEGAEHVYADFSDAYCDLLRTEGVSVGAVSRVTKSELSIRRYDSSLDSRSWKDTTAARKQYLQHKVGHPRTYP